MLEGRTMWSDQSVLLLDSGEVKPPVLKPISG